MRKYILRRLIQAIPTFFGITLISYLVMVIAPGDPVSILSFNPQMKAEDKARLAIELGTNDPWPVQYLRWLIGDDWIMVDTNGDGEVDDWGSRYGILRGDFGKSFAYKESPLVLIGERLGATIELNIAVLFVSIVGGLSVGVLAAIKRGQTFDNTARVIAVIVDSTPIFWLGFIFIMLFGIILPNLLQGYGIGDGSQILPMGGRCAPVRGGCPPVYQRLEYLILPTLVLGLGGIAGWSRFMRASMLDTIHSDYMRTARAKGLTARGVWLRHGLRNAIIPMAVFLGPAFVGLLGGAVITETVFAWPGVGRLLVKSVTSQDYPLVMASVVIGSILTIIGYIIADIMYASFDPRVRFA